MVMKEFIHRKIYDFQGHKIMFDFDLSELYDVETRTLKQAVRRNGRSLSQPVITYQKRLSTVLYLHLLSQSRGLQC